MATVNQILNKILVYCGRPLEDSLTLPDMLDILYGRIDYYRGKLGISNRNWLLNRFILTVDGTTDEYSISARAGDFGRPVLFETYDDSLQNFERRPIPIVEVQNSSLVYPDIVNPSNFSVSTYFKHTAQAIAFWGYESSDIKCRVIPQPIQVADYQLWYEPGKANDPLPSDSPMLQPEFHDLLAVHSATLGLANCKWYAKKDYMDASELDLERMNMDKQNQQINFLIPELQRLGLWFDEYRRSNKLERAAKKQPFNRYRSYSSGRRTR